MRLEHYDKIVSLTRPSQSIEPGDAAMQRVAFHTERLEVAELHPSLAQYFTSETFSSATSASPASSEQDKLMGYLREWSAETPEPPNLPSSSKKVQSITLNVTQICNLHCTYCAAGGDGTFGNPIKKVSIEKTLPQLAHFMERLEPGDLFHVNFLGGEPTLYPDAMAAIAEYVTDQSKQKGFESRFVVTTNATLITDKVLDIFSNFRFHVNVSLDGPPEINDRIRVNKNGKGVTDKIVGGLQKLLARNPDLGSLGITAVFDRNHLTVVDTYRYFKKFTVDWYEFNFSHTETDVEASQLFAKEMAEVGRIAFANGGESEIRRIRFFDLIFDQLDSQIQSVNFCGAGKSLLMVDAQNDIYPCPWMVGDASEKLGEGLQLSQKRLDALAGSLVDLNSCHDCWARFVCGGGCMYIHKHTTGSKHQKSLAFCDRTRELIAEAIWWYHEARSRC